MRKAVRKFITFTDADNNCIRTGQYRKIPLVNKQQVKDLMDNANTSVNSANFLASSIDEKDPRWMSVYTGYYEALHILAEAFLQFDKYKIANHQCLFAFLCKNHPEFEKHWGFFEEARFNRNGVYYYGSKISHDDWAKAKPNYLACISALKKGINKKMKDYKDKAESE